MNEEEYLKLRLDDQIDWYDGKSSAAQKCSNACVRVEIVLAAIIPVLASVSALSLLQMRRMLLILRL